MSKVTTDPIADMLTRIRNAINVRQSETTIPYSKMKESVARILVDNHYLENVTVNQDDRFKKLVITINASTANAKISEISRLSTPGRRLYVNADRIPKVKNGRGIVVLSTSKGLMTGHQAHKMHIGGELICKVY